MDITWVTGKGSHRHVSHTCANQRRAITTGDPRVATGDDLELPLCEHCTPAETLAAQPKVAKAEPKAWCSNPGVEQPRQYRSTCTACGRTAIVMRNGKLKSHRVR